MVFAVLSEGFENNRCFWNTVNSVWIRYSKVVYAPTSEMNGVESVTLAAICIGFWVAYYGVFTRMFGPLECKVFFPESSFPASENKFRYMFYRIKVL
jgi:hypothetical protein